MPFLFIELWYLWDFGPSPAKLVLFDIRHTKFPNRRVKKFLFVFCLKMEVFIILRYISVFFLFRLPISLFLWAFLKEKGFIESDVIANNSQSRFSIIWIGLIIWMSLKVFFPEKLCFLSNPPPPHFRMRCVGKIFSSVFSGGQHGCSIIFYDQRNCFIRLGCSLLVIIYILNIWYFFKSAFPASQNVACQG